MVATRFQEVGYANLWEYDGCQMIDMSSWIAVKREEMADQIYLHNETMFYCSACGCHMRTFADHSSKCSRCRRRKQHKLFIRNVVLS